MAKKQRIWAVVSFLLPSIDHTDVEVKTVPKSSVKCIVRKSEITLNQNVVIRDYDTVAWVKRLSPDIIGRKLSSQRTEGIFGDLRTDGSENHDLQPRATTVDGGCYIVMSTCWNT